MYGDVAMPWRATGRGKDGRYVHSVSQYCCYMRPRQLVLILFLLPLTDDGRKHLTVLGTRWMTRGERWQRCMWVIGVRVAGQSVQYTLCQFFVFLVCFPHCCQIVTGKEEKRSRVWGKHWRWKQTLYYLEVFTLSTKNCQVWILQPTPFTSSSTLIRTSHRDFNVPQCYELV